MRSGDLISLSGTTVTRPFASPDVAAGAGAPGVGNLTEVTLALVFVLLLVFGLAWIARRLRVAIRPEGPGMTVLGELALGAKERAVLVRVGETQILLGVAPGRVSPLHVLSAQEIAAARAAAPAASSADPAGQAGVAVPRFAELLRRSLGRAP